MFKTLLRLGGAYLKHRGLPNSTSGVSRTHRISTGSKVCNVGLALSVLSWLGFDADDEKKESDLIMTLKRAVLCTRREQYDKAEQMLHLALRLAQQQQNMQGILYCYDLMANLAFERLQLNKAEKLFVNVMQLLLSTGVPEDDIKMIHVSLKLARICHLLAEEEKAKIGYEWCLEKITKRKTEDADSKVLYGVIQDWYAQFLLDQGENKKALVHLKEAYKVCADVGNEEKAMLLLNDLGITSWRAGDVACAEEYLGEAVKSGKRLEDKTHVGVVHANLGLVYLDQGLTVIAEKTCQNAKNMGVKYENTESIEQAKYCLEQIQAVLGK